MKKNIFAVAMTLGLILGMSASAQPAKPRNRKAMERPTVEQMARMKTDRMKEQLALSDAQAEQIYVYNLEQARQAAARYEAFKAKQKVVQEQREAERKARFEQFRAERKAEAAEMQRMLTPEQFAKWEQLQKQGRPGAGKMHKGDRRQGPQRMRRGAPHGEKYGRAPHRAPKGKEGKPEFRGEQQSPKAQ